MRSPSPQRNTVLSIFGICPNRINAGAMFARELSVQLTGRGWDSVLCFLEPPTEPVRQFLEAPNVTLDVVADSASLNLRVSRRVFEVLRQYRPRILHLYFTSFLNPYSWMAKLLGVEQVWFTDQTSQPEGFVPRLAPWWKRAAMRAIHYPLTGVISVSGYGYRNFVARGLLPEQRFRLVYNAIPTERAKTGADKGPAFRRRHGISPGALVSTQVSWLIPEKGLDDLLTAARDVVAAEPAAHFVIAGEGAHRPKLEVLARDLKIRDHVTFTGGISDPFAEGLYAASDVVCQMSRWEEVFGYVNAEAMACGKPLVGTRAGGIPEIIQEGKTGFVVEKRDTAAMAARILTLLRDPDLRRKMGQAGLAVCREKFELKKNVGQQLKIYGIG
jgi:glycosyltransferase involved in cell wall biosynthesis